MNICPSCKTEMISRYGIQVCPRNEIGDCTFDAYHEQEYCYRTQPQYFTPLNQSNYQGERS